MSSISHYAGELSKNLDRLKKLGHEEAKDHRPASNAAALDPNEAAIVADAKKWLLQEQRLFDSAITEASRSVTELEQKTIDQRTSIDQLLGDESAAGAVESTLAAERSELVRLTEAKLRAEAEWRYFTKTNNISERAVYPESQIFNIGSLFVLVLVETSINAFFYENEAGLLGGATVAFGVSVLSLGLAVLLGYAFRYQNLAAPKHKAIGWGSFAIFLVVLLYLNALFATFRAEYQLLKDTNDPYQLQQAFTAAAQRAGGIFKADAGFSDFLSFILFGLGVLSVIWAFRKGYTLDDKYPGYGAKDRTLNETRTAEEKAQAEVRSKVRTLLEKRAQELQSALRAPGNLIGAAASRITAIQHAETLLTTNSKSIHRDFELAIDTYRQANTAVRATPPPAYFQTLPELKLPDERFPESQRVIQQLSEAQDRLKALREEYESVVNNKLKDVQAESSRAQNERLPAFMAEVQKGAEENITRLTHTVRRVD